jgi:hypothetical protein
LAEALRDTDTLEPSLRTYLERRNGDKILIVNIESVPAIEALDEIRAVPGLDAVLIGPHDLSCNLGIPEQYDHPRIRRGGTDDFSDGPVARRRCWNTFLARAGPRDSLGQSGRKSLVIARFGHRDHHPHAQGRDPTSYVRR